ncbi:MAG: hypothetical protein KDH16_21065 [Rhodocyclaceae bacterium]|nr:hypothetical protein [Rhodocyclaceae bacterium]
MGDADPPTHQTTEAITVYSMLSNGMGGIDWAGFPIVAALLEIDDIDGLVRRLHIIKTHKPDKG